MSTQRKTPYRLGVVILLVLITLLVTEFAISGFNVPPWAIYIFGFIQAGIIIHEYMHVSRLFKDDKNKENSGE